MLGPSCPSFSSSTFAGSSSLRRHSCTNQHCAVVRSRPVVVAKAAADGDDASAPTLYGDWREFRAKLIADAGQVNWASRVCAENTRVLELQNPKLAAEETWAHATTHPEKGGLLLATPEAPAILNNDRYCQVVILLVECSPDGCVGLIVNRPSLLRLGVGRGGLKFSIIGAPAGMQDVFADQRVYCGGMIRQDVFHVLHGHNLEGSLEVAPGVYVGGEAAAVTAVRERLIPAADFKFYCGAMVWEGNELQEQIKKGAWYTAAGSRNLALKQCLELPKPLWQEVLGLMGGQYACIAAQADVD